MQKTSQDYVVGDIQGCLDELLVLLDKVGFDSNIAHLWLTGDLVARGPKSLETLRFVKSLGSSATTVLGNHDLHLIATHFGLKRAKKNDKLDDLLAAPDIDELIQWLLHQPMLAVINDTLNNTPNNIHNNTPNKTLNNTKTVMTHAGISPQWDIPTAIKLAKEVETILQGDECYEYLANMYQNTPARWDDNLTGHARFRYIVNCLTRMRFCFDDRAMDFVHKDAPDKTADPQLQPWFSFQPDCWSGHQLLFGHWASLMGNTGHENIIALDTGCVWG
ncbi:MAG: symmetrical bis(5'-nucleosyl)-tetraphosphatase, partial [Psychrosphaera sp.]|nr:symmetrical bis(5'-nucleosyl)-tetraphosphatase [Psychrosphaera sp.]